jgi:hypothetical protein
MEVAPGKYSVIDADNKEIIEYSIKYNDTERPVSVDDFVDVVLNRINETIELVNKKLVGFGTVFGYSAGVHDPVLMFAIGYMVRAILEAGNMQLVHTVKKVSEQEMKDLKNSAIDSLVNKITRLKS